MTGQGTRSGRFDHFGKAPVLEHDPDAHDINDTDPPRDKSVGLVPIIILNRERDADTRVLAVAARLHQPKDGTFDLFQLIDAADLGQGFLSNCIDAEHYRIDFNIAEKFWQCFR